MNRWLVSAACALLGLVMCAVGWLVPVHLRALDAVVLQKAGQGTVSLAEKATALANSGKPGPAGLLVAAGEIAQAPGLAKPKAAVANLLAPRSAVSLWGGPEPGFAKALRIEPPVNATGRVAFAEIAVRMEVRQGLLQLLGGTRSAVVRELLLSRGLTNTFIFSPSQSSSGQAFDTAVCIGGTLLVEGKFTPALSNAVLGLALQGNQSGQSPRLEQVLVDLMSLGQRFDWTQLSAFVSRIQDPETLRLAGTLARSAGRDLPVLFSAVEMSGQPAEVCRYLTTYSQTGLSDLAAAMRYGAGGLNELLSRSGRFYAGALGSAWLRQAPLSGLAWLAWRVPGIALALKWLLLFGGGFLLALAVHYALPKVTLLERPLQVRGFHVARETLFGLGFLAILLLVTEPNLTQESQRVEFPFRVRLPVEANLVSAIKTANIKSFMHQMSLLTLLMFFVLQALIYTACLFKLAEIRRQKVAPRMKLLLLANEDHLFDAGLYLGFVGTIISLILVSLGIIKPSLMAAYSSTSFGIIFVSIFKIFHLRPYRRKLLLEAEAGPAEAVETGAAGTFATQS